MNYINRITERVFCEVSDMINKMVLNHQKVLIRNYEEVKVAV